MNSINNNYIFKENNIKILEAKNNNRHIKINVSPYVQNNGDDKNNINNVISK